MRDLEQSLPLKLLKAREAVMGRFRPNLNAHEITDQQWRVLRALVEYDELSAGDLAKLVTLLMPSLTRILQALEARKLVKRERSAEDKRLVKVRITASGRKLFDSIAPNSEKQYRAIEMALGDARYRRLMAELDDLILTLRSVKGENDG